MSALISYKTFLSFKTTFSHCPVHGEISRAMKLFSPDCFLIFFWLFSLLLFLQLCLPLFSSYEFLYSFSRLCLLITQAMIPALFSLLFVLSDALLHNTDSLPYNTAHFLQRGVTYLLSWDESQISGISLR